jgi:DNA polymerase III epsilon subunit-like protein
MKILCFDTETTGITPRCQPSFTNISEWPYIVQLAFILFDTDEKKILVKHDFIVDVNENKVQIPAAATNVHGITNTISKERGLPIHNVLNCFLCCLHQCDMLVAHNLQFDWDMINAEILRQLLKDGTKIEKNLIQKPPKVIHYCTMKNSVELCRIEMTNKYTGEKFFKYPKQEQLHNYLFGNKPNNLHNAFNDVLVCLRCFYKLWYDEDVLMLSKQMRSLYKKVI